VNSFVASASSRLRHGTAVKETFDAPRLLMIVFSNCSLFMTLILHPRGFEESLNTPTHTSEPSMILFEQRRLFRHRNPGKGSSRDIERRLKGRD
jgi:hypothetical protein